jgi:hypothetical protein
MQNNKLIRTITEANLPLELVAKEEFDNFKAKKHTYVAPMELRSSKGILISENFSRCQGIVLFDYKAKVGALAHNYSENDPYDTLTGAWTGEIFHLEDPKATFSDTSRVLAVHVYHEYAHDYPERWIEGALERVGIKNVIHIPIKSKEAHRIQWRHVVHDVKDGSVYIFPTDFDKGIKYHLNDI